MFDDERWAQQEVRRCAAADYNILHCFQITTLTSQLNNSEILHGLGDGYIPKFAVWAAMPTTNYQLPIPGSRLSLNKTC